MSIRILHLIGNLHLGGAQMVVKQIVENARDEQEHFVYPLRAKKIDIPIDGEILTNSYCTYDLRKFFDILRICRQHQIDIIHTHLHKSAIGALLATYFVKIPVIVHEHGPIARSGIQYSAYRLMLRMLKKRARRFVAVSNTAAGQLTQLAGVDPKHIDIIHNAVDLDRFRPDPQVRQALRKKMQISPTQTVIGFAGRLSHVKGPDILLEALAMLKQKMPETMLVYIGQGPMQNELAEKAKTLGLQDRVRFLGFCENISEMMNMFDIGCMPSRQESFGIAALEMMSMKIPLVCSGVDGLSELVNHGNHAVVPLNNSAACIAESMIQLVNDTALRQSLIENAFSFVQEFGIANYIKQMNDMYRLILNQR